MLASPALNAPVTAAVRPRCARALPQNWPGDFFAVSLGRIADPAVPNGCLLAQSAAEVPMLSAASQDLIRAALRRQHARVLSPLLAGGLDREKAGELASLVVAVNQSLAVLSRAGRPLGELRAVARVTCATVGDAVKSAEIRMDRVHEQ